MYTLYINYTYNTAGILANNVLAVGTNEVTVEIKETEVYRGNILTFEYTVYESQGDSSDREGTAFSDCEIRIIKLITTQRL